MHFYGWKKGLKTGMYYLRTRPAAQAIQFTVDQSVLKGAKKNEAAQRNAAKANGVASLAPAASAAVPLDTSFPVLSDPPTPITTVDDTTHSDPPTPSTTATTASSQPEEILTLDERTQKAAEQDPEFAAALRRQRQRELEQEKLMCSLENKEACLMCSS
ncbi:predicted protein [Postia placenta Mad-698-R]|nr:predicted protein [Postia placenta Mad-698-R]